MTATATLVYNTTIAPTQDIRVFIRYAGSPGNWLTAVLSRSSVSAQIVLSADPSSLPEGTHSAEILVTVDQYSRSASATVMLTVGPLAVNPAGLAASPSTLTFIPRLSTDAQTLTVANAPGVTGSIPFAAVATTDNWLSVTQVGQSSPAAVKVQAVATGLSAGIHTAAVMITTATGRVTVAPVAIVVSREAVGPTIVLSPAQRALTFNFQTGATSNPGQTVYITTDSSQYLYFTASTTTPWIGIAAAAWITPASTAACFAPGLFYVSVDPTGLSPGAHQGSIVLEAPGVDSVEVPVTLNISSIPVLNSNPSFLTFDSASNLLTSNLAITASSAFFFTASVSASTPWLKIAANSGVASADPISLAVTANVAGLPAGTYNGSVTLTGPMGQPTMTIPVQLKVSGSAVTNSVRLTPTTIEFGAVSGDIAMPQYVTISSDLASVDSFNVAAVADGGWLIAEAMANPRGFVKVTVNTAMAPGVYSGSITATSLLSGDAATANVVFRNAARTFAATPSTLTFRQAEAGAAIPPQELQVTSNRATAFRILAQPDWATVRTPAVMTTPATLVVTVNVAGLLPGQYDGVLRLSGPAEIAIPISLVLPEPTPPAVTPASVTFLYDLNAPPPATQSVKVSNALGPVGFTTQTATVSGVDWLVAEPTSGMTPGAIALKVNVTRLVPGQHSGTLTIRVESAPPKVLTVPVTLTVRGASVQVQAVLNRATMQPSALAPGMLVTLLGLGLGPDTPVLGRPSAAGSYETQLAGVQVRFDDAAAPLLFVSSEMIHAIVPYSTYGRATVKIQAQNGQGYGTPIEVKVVDAAPGVFTQAQNGRGAAAALNADLTPNSVLNPAKVGNVVTVYLTGEGQTDPPGQDGRIISTDIRKPLLPVSASIGGLPATVLYAGSAPDTVSGICQVNLQVPEGLAPGAQTLEIQVGGVSSQRAVTIQVQ